jgi:hypothetical protein
MGVVTINPFNALITNIFFSYEFSVIYIFGIIYILQYFMETINYENLIISLISGIMLPFSIILILELFNNNYYQPILIYSFSLYYAYYTETIDIILMFSLFGLFIIFLSFIVGYFYSFYKKYAIEKTVTIIRGVPGIGKTSYIASMEYDYDDNNDYKVCYWQYYYGKGLKYKYRPNETKQAELWTLMLFINYMIRRISRIYVVSTFENIWQYDIYIYLAKIFKYKVKIVELECINKQYLQHFQQRSNRNIPLSRAIRIFNDWQYDERAILQDPFIEPELLGDSIPIYDNTNSISLDKELEAYFRNPLDNNKNNTNNANKICDNRIRTNYIISNISEYDKELFGL